MSTSPSWQSWLQTTVQLGSTLRVLEEKSVSSQQVHLNSEIQRNACPSPPSSNSQPGKMARFLLVHSQPMHSLYQRCARASFTGHGATISPLIIRLRQVPGWMGSFSRGMVKRGTDILNLLVPFLEGCKNVPAYLPMHELTCQAYAV